MRCLGFYGKIVLLLLLEAGIILSATAQTNLASDTIALYVELQCVSLVASPSDLPFSRDKIDLENIQNAKAPTIEPLLNSTPGLWMQTGALNTNRISLRGVGYREPFATTGIKIYLDDIPLTNGVGEASVEDIHPGILSGIEILRGPGSAIWGAGLGGMILLNTQPPEKDLWTSDIQFGMYDRLKLDQKLELVYGKDDNLSSQIQYQYLTDNGYRSNNTYVRHSGTWIQQWKNNTGWSLQTLVHGIDLKAYIPSSLNLADFDDHPDRAAPTWASVQGNEDYAKWLAGATLGFFSARGFLYRGTVFGTGFSSEEVRPFNVLDEHNTVMGTRQRFAWMLEPDMRISVGAEYYYESSKPATFETLPGGLKGTMLSEENEHRTYLHVFSQAVWWVNSKVDIFAGVSSAYSHLKDDVHETHTAPSIYPTAGVNYRVSFHLHIKGSVSRGYTALSLGQLVNSDGEIQSGLKPESGWNEEIGISLTNYSGFSCSVNAYVMQINNTIITRRIVDDQFERYNGGSTLHRGIEAECELGGEDQRHWEWSGAYTYNAHRFRQFDDGGVNYSGNALPGVPRHHAWQRVSVDLLKDFEFAMVHQWVSGIWLDDANTVRGPGHNLINTQLSYSNNLHRRWKYTASLQLHNVLNAQYASMFQINAPGAVPRYYYPGKPRSLYLNIGFQKTL